MGFRDIGTKIDDKIMGAKVALIQQLGIWERNFVSLADHLIDHGLELEAETEELLEKTRAALLAEKAKLEKELAGPASAPATEPEKPTVIEHDFAAPPASEPSDADPGL